jgi:hypothetical protein
MIEINIKAKQRVVMALLKDSSWLSTAEYPLWDAYLLGRLTDSDGVTFDQIRDDLPGDGKRWAVDGKRWADVASVRTFLRGFQKRLESYYQTPAGRESPYRIQLRRTTSANRYRLFITRKTDAESPLRVFLCHSSGDKRTIRKLYTRLAEDGFLPWLDQEDLLPGHDWESEIRKAVRTSDVVLSCLSPSSITKQGFVQKEIRMALDAADEKPDGTVYIIPVLLKPCSVPERLQKWQWIDLCKPLGYERLVASLNTLRPREQRAKKRRPSQK